MARIEYGAETGGLGGDAGSDVFFELGRMYASGKSVDADLVTAHKWFNIAAIRGSSEAARRRSELAEEMTRIEIAAAQRAARDWLRSH